MGYRQLGKIIGIATNRKSGSQDFTVLVHRSGYFEEINVHDDSIESKELELGAYVSRLKELKKDPKYSSFGKSELSIKDLVGKKLPKDFFHIDVSEYFDLTEPQLVPKRKEELIKSGLTETQEKPCKRAVGFDQVWD